MINLKVENNFCEFLIDEIVSRLKGSHPNYSRLILNQMPHRFIILGSLAPKICKGTIDSGEPEILESEESRRTIISERIKSISFLVESDRLELNISIYFYVFLRSVPTFEEQILFSIGYEGAIGDVIGEFKPSEAKIIDNIALVWERREIAIQEDLKLDLSQLKLSRKPRIISLKEKVIKALESQQKTIIVPKSDYLKICDCLGNKDKFLKSIAENSIEVSVKETAEKILDIALYIQCEEYQQNEKNLNKLKISIVNESIFDKRINKHHIDPAIFDCRLEIKMDREIVPFKMRDQFARASKEEIYVRANNCNAVYHKDRRLIITKNHFLYPEIRIKPRISTPDNHKIVPKFSTLSNLNEGGLKILEEIYMSLSRYYSDLSKEIPELKDGIEIMVNRYKAGLELLRTDVNAKRAFELMNKTFEYNSRGSYSEWRLFQIVFILCNLSDVAKMSNIDYVDLLNVSTGGGKTETYFGLCVFAAFYNRLIGRDFGTTAIIKFPLRMLSIQQLQRLIGIVAWSNYVKKEELLRGEDFSLGFFVGKSKDFPESSSEVIKSISTKPIKGKFIEKCPICGSEIYLKYDSKTLAILHYCSNSNCFMHNGLAIHYTHREIYRFLPTFIVSTVDKMSAVSYNRRFRSILGGRVKLCKKGHGYIPNGDWCQVSDSNSSNKKDTCRDKGDNVVLLNLGPCLMIQDELHLIREGFGSIDAHFETLIETMKEKFTGKGFKHICTTATISGAETQIYNLYLKKMLIFPPESTYEISKFFFEEVQESGEKIVGRYIVGLRPNLRDNQYATLLTLRYLILVILSILKDPGKFSIQLKIPESELIKILKKYMSYLTYHTKKADVHSISFYMRDVVESKFQYNPELNIGNILIKKTLTGDDTTEEVKELVKELSNFERATEPRIYVTSATNIVSHGVDISTWNIMIFQGMPRSTAEYIQALSRIGRISTGIVFVWYYPTRIRDLDFYKNFEVYHRTLNWHVEISPLTRWSKLAFEQTAPSVFCAAVLNYLSELKGATIYSDREFMKHFVNENTQEEKVEKNIKQIIEFITRAYIRDDKENHSERIASLVPKKVEEIRNYIVKDIKYSNPKSFFPSRLSIANTSGKYRLLYGLRGVQDMITLEYESHTYNFLKKNFGR
ncbi:MAG: helicase-related protein [Archaeoglobaceae archaeon]|nr:helicase-related protein [Archaeoglobaceae archaeon]